MSVRRVRRGAFPWGVQQTRAARLVAEDRLIDVEIAGVCGVAERTLERWKLHPQFAARVARVREQLAAAELASGIADRQRRVAKLDRRHQALEQVIEERGAETTMRKVPGGTTGLVVRSYKMIGRGTAAQMVEEYKVDDGTLHELREIEKQAAIELGQWTEKRELAGQGGGPIMVIEMIPPAATAQGETHGAGD